MEEEPIESGGGPAYGGEALDTRVSGDSRSCERSADWLDTYVNNATWAANYSSEALVSATESWQGPASDRFTDVLRSPRHACDDLAYTCGTYATALRDFAGELDSVNELMAEARDKATEGELEMTGEFILPPVDPGEPPGPFSGTVSGEDAVDAYQDWIDSVNAFNEKVDEYNEKVDTFNACGEIVADARKQEDEAHAELLRALVPGDIDIDEYYDELTSTQRDLFDTLRESHAHLLDKSSRLARAAPHVEGALTVTTEIVAAIRGDQSWPEAAVDVGKPIATSTAIKAGLKVPGPPVVKVLAAAGAGIGVEVGIDKIIGKFVGDDPYAQPTLDHKLEYRVTTVAIRPDDY